MINKWLISFLSFHLLFSICIGKKQSKEKNKKKIPTKTITPAGTFKSLKVIGNETVDSNLSVGGAIASNNLSVLNNATIGKNNCHNGTLTVNGNQTVRDNVTVGKTVFAQRISTDTLTSNKQTTDSLSSSSIKTRNLSVLDDAHVAGALYSNEIDPLNGSNTAFSGDIAINDQKALLVNQINPVKKISCSPSCNQFEIDPDGGICIGGKYVSLGSDTVFMANEINPTDGFCGVDETGTTTFSGNLFVNKNLGFYTTDGEIGIVNIFEPTIKGNRLPGAEGTFHSFIHNFGAYNTFVGKDAGNFSMDGYNNTGFGLQALGSNTNGAGNAAFGTFSLAANTTAAGNTGFGCFSLQMTTTGYENTAIGDGSLMTNTLGFQNTALGESSMLNNTTGSQNTALGAYALENIFTGTSNIAIGFEAADNYNGSESSNIIIGNAGQTGESSTTRIGAEGVQTQCFIAGIQNNILLGSPITSPVVIDGNGQLGVLVAPSSLKYKRQITDLHDRSEQFMQLRPVTFKYKHRPEDAPYEFGLIAEEVAQILPEIVIYDDQGEPESIRYQALPTLLLKEYQTQQKKIATHTEKLEEIIENFATKEELNNLIERLINLEKTIQQKK